MRAHFSDADFPMVRIFNFSLAMIFAISFGCTGSNSNEPVLTNEVVAITEDDDDSAGTVPADDDDVFTSDDDDEAAVADDDDDTVVTDDDDDLTCGDTNDCDTDGWCNLQCSLIADPDCDIGPVCPVETDCEADSTCNSSCALDLDCYPEPAAPYMLQVLSRKYAQRMFIYNLEPVTGATVLLNDTVYNSDASGLVSIADPGENSVLTVAEYGHDIHTIFDYDLKASLLTTRMITGDPFLSATSVILDRLGIPESGDNEVSEPLYPVDFTFDLTTEFLNKYCNVYYTRLDTGTGEWIDGGSFTKNCASTDTLTYELPAGDYFFSMTVGILNSNCLVARTFEPVEISPGGANLATLSQLTPRTYTVESSALPPGFEVVSQPSINLKVFDPEVPLAISCSVAPTTYSDEITFVDARYGDRNFSVIVSYAMITTAIGNYDVKIIGTGSDINPDCGRIALDFPDRLIELDETNTTLPNASVANMGAIEVRVANLGQVLDISDEELDLTINRRYSVPTTYGYTLGQYQTWNLEAINQDYLSLSTYYSSVSQEIGVDPLIGDPADTLKLCLTAKKTSMITSADAAQESAWIEDFAASIFACPVDVQSIYTGLYDGTLGSSGYYRYLYHTPSPAYSSKQVEMCWSVNLVPE